MKRIVLLFVFFISFVYSNEIVVNFTEEKDLSTLNQSAFKDALTQKIKNNKRAWVKIHLNEIQSNEIVISLPKDITVQDYFPKTLMKLTPSSFKVYEQDFENDIYFFANTSHTEKKTVEVKINSLNEYLFFENAEKYFYGFYLGMLFLIIVYNLQWFKTLHEWSYFYYALFQISMIITVLHSSGFVYEFNIYESTSSYYFPGVCAVVSAILFSKEFLELKKYYPKVNRMVNISVILLIVVAIIAYVTQRFDFFSIPFSLLFSPFLVLGILLYKNGYAPAKYFILGWGVFIFSILLSDINKIMGLEVLSFHHIIHGHIIHVGNLLEAVIITFALSYKTRLLIEQKNEKEKMLIHQSRLASMGEMLANIAHQWRQPLNRVASFIMNMQMQLLLKDEKKDEYISEKLTMSQDQLNYMSSTIDDFINFFSPDKVKEDFEVKQQILEALKIINPSLKSKDIQVHIECKEDFIINGYAKEFSQVILNLFQNSKDAIISNNIQTPELNVTIDKNRIYVQDNAGGIPADIIHQIFTPYFTTKDKAHGTGLGLYMSKIIIEKNMDAILSVTNKNTGACFKIDFS